MNIIGSDFYLNEEIPKKYLIKNTMPADLKRRAHSLKVAYENANANFPTTRN